jgi:hypothetical protein
VASNTSTLARAASTALARKGEARIARLVSGGQSGGDRAALDVALELGVPCGGWCPRGRKAEDGTIPDRYPLAETPSEDYGERGGPGRGRTGRP